MVFNINNFFDNRNKKLFFFSEIMIMFFEFFFKIFNAKTLDKVSTVLPDFEIIIKSVFEKFFFFF